MAKLPKLFDARLHPPGEPDNDFVRYDYPFISEQVRPISQAFAKDCATDGRFTGSKYEWRNYKRGEKSIGSAYIDLNDGRWSDLGGAVSGGDFISFWAYHYDCSQHDAAAEICERYGLSPNNDLPSIPAKTTAAKNAPMPTTEESENKSRKAAIKLIEESVPAGPDNPAGRYLEKRGLGYHDDIRYARDFDGRHVCIFVGRDGSGNAGAIQRVYITEDGDKLTDPETGKVLPKKTLGSVKSHPYRCPPSRADNPDRLILTEGPEDAKSISQTTGYETIAMFGAANLRNAPVAGRDVLIFADSDGKTETIERTQKAVEMLAPQNLSVNYIYPPQSSGDANTMLMDGNESGLRDLVEKGFGGGVSLTPRQVNIDDWTGDSYAGPAPELKYLIEGVIPVGVPIVLAAEGGLGKSMKLLSLCLAVALTSDDISDEIHFGGRVMLGGTAVMFTAEDSQATVHRRLQSLDPAETRLSVSDRIRIIPLPSAGGPQSLVNQSRDGFQATTFFNSIKAQLLGLTDLRLVVIDPLQAFVSADINKDPAAAQYFWSALSSICAETGATLIVTHHIGKMKDGIHSTSDARNAIRGTTAIVDGARGAYVYWEAPEDKAKPLCQELNEIYEPKKIIYGALVKANELGDQSIRTEIRLLDGKFRDVTKRAEDKVDAIDRRNREKEIDRHFLACLDKHNDGNRSVSDKKGVNYAPKILSKMPEASGHSARDLELAMERLFDRKEIIANVKVAKYDNRNVRLGIARNV